VRGESEARARGVQRNALHVRPQHRSLRSSSRFSVFCRIIPVNMIIVSIVLVLVYTTLL
jgi:hypothetical protein